MVVLYNDAMLTLALMDDPPRLAVRGDVDVSNADQLVTALTKISREFESNVHLECDRMDFIDLHGLRAAVIAASELSDTGRHLILDSLSPYYIRVFELIGWSRAPGLRLNGPVRTPSPARPEA